MKDKKPYQTDNKNARNVVLTATKISCDDAITNIHLHFSGFLIFGGVFFYFLFITVVSML